MRQRYLIIVIVAWLSHVMPEATVRAQDIVSSNPLEYIALAEGNALINSQVSNGISHQRSTAMLQNTIAAEYTMMNSWEKKYSAYLKDVSGYASSLKACSHLYDDGVRIFIGLAKVREAIQSNPEGIAATIAMNDIFLETATELVTIYSTLREAVAAGGSGNMLTGAERSRMLWELSDHLDSFSHRLAQLQICIRYYTKNDVWRSATAGMIDRRNGEIAHDAHVRWVTLSKSATP